PFTEETPGILSEAAWPAWSAAAAARTALAVGPGLGQHPSTAALVHRLLREMRQPMVLDADGLTLCADTPELLQTYAGALILTPHPGELSRLTGLAISAILADPLAAAGAWAKKFGHILVLKGNPTIIAAPDGALFLNATGNPGMATAGSGDVLTGVIAGLLAQGLSPLDAALCGVWLHGAAGDLARDRKGEMGMIAGDLLETLPTAIQMLRPPC
ncbi:MAG TPA: NAD(P)H-hydrate dehydratase, partial [bacterium]|nr:NAD(P)H-hydrate dehydratase [bacterium]